MQVNTEIFYSVQLTSGTDDYCVQVARTYEEAVSLADQHDATMQANFERWMNGDNQADVMIESHIEPDLNGGCYTSFTIHSACLSAPVQEHKIGTQEMQDWKNVKGANKIRWGNPATARPRATVNA